VAEISRAEADEATWLRNIDTAASMASRSDTILRSVTGSLDRAKELMLAAATGTMSSADRSVIAGELRGIAEELSSLRETRDPRGEPLFRTNGPLEIPVSSGVRIAPVPGRAEIFDSPVDLVASIQAAAAAAVEPDAATRTTAIRASLTSLDSAAAQVAKARADQGVRADRLDKLPRPPGGNEHSAPGAAHCHRGRRHHRGNRSDRVEDAQPQGGAGDFCPGQPDQPVRSHQIMSAIRINQARH
jgi:flagellin-like hook-associated protein FlgL